MHGIRSKVALCSAANADFLGAAMARTADYTVQGFLYQFNKSLLAILEANDDEEIIVEGPIEDIDIVTSNGITAIQCKYHEAAGSFALSVIYKPLLQMMEHFANNPDSCVSYRIYAHFPSERPGEREITLPQVKDVLGSQNQALRSLISRITDLDHQAFLDRFTLEFGDSLGVLAAKARDKLITCGLAEDTIDIIAYPNAIHRIAQMSICHAAEDRRTKKSTFVDQLKELRATAISRWTRFLSTWEKLLAERKKQLRDSLGLNVRRRYLFISSSRIHDFDSHIVDFIHRFIDKYYCKPAHTHVPLFCLDCAEEVFRSVCQRLRDKGIKFADGISAAGFRIDDFYRAPHNLDFRKGKFRPEFRLRICRYNGSFDVLNHCKCDDMFVVSREDMDAIDKQDVNMEMLDAENFQELSYLLGLSHAIK